jgi:hypothetical protein
MLSHSRRASPSSQTSLRLDGAVAWRGQRKAALAPARPEMRFASPQVADRPAHPHASHCAPPKRHPPTSAERCQLSAQIGRAYPAGVANDGIEEGPEHRPGLPLVDRG